LRGQPGPVPIYLVERYWPGVTRDQVLEALEQGRRVMEQMRGEGTRIRDINCILIPAEVVLSLYEGPSLDAVRRFNERAGIPTSRTVDVIALVKEGVAAWTA
jgi:hypothetical protein